MEKIKKVFTHRCNEKEIKLDLILDKNLKLSNYLLGDFAKVNQVLNNLLGNAIKFTSKGSITLEINKVYEDEKKLALYFEVRDTGIGIAREKIQFIFELFSQANNRISRKYGGTGLGLTISKRLIEILGGEIKLESEVGKGSSFSFSLYFEKSIKKLVSKKQDKKTEVLDLERKNILLVEDNHLNQYVAKKFLLSWNAEIDIAENGIVALEKMKTKEYDIVLMDLHMPKMDGYEATKQIRLLSGAYFQNIPIIALSASAIGINTIKFEKMGINDFIRKPFNPINLYRVIKKHLRE